MSDIHRRQKELKGWDQSVISELTCLVLGIGGYGTNISSNLCRLGVKKIILVDMDVVEEHNLNRQILFRKEHIGRPKVHCALEELERHNNVSGTVIESYDMDALKNWQLTLKLIQESDVIFNSIDHGDYFDLVICKIAEKYKIPIVLGGTEPFYGHTVSYFLQGVYSDDPKYWDCHDLTKIGIMDCQVEQIESFDDLLFLPKDSHPTVGGSTVYSAATGSHLMTSAMINYLHHLKNPERPNPPKQVIFNLLTMESTFWFN